MYMNMRDYPTLQSETN